MTDSNSSLVVGIIDDDAPVRDSMGAVIEILGCDVQSWESAEQFLSDHVRSRIDLLIIDVRLPGMSGLELLQHLAAEGLTPPCVVMTGHADVQDAELQFWPNKISVLAKPCAPGNLLEIISLWLRI